MNGTISRILKFCGRYFTSVFCSLFLHTFGLISRRNRELMTTVNRHFGFSASGEKAPVPCVIPETGIAEIVSPDLKIAVQSPEYEDGGITPFELICLNLITAGFSPERCFEIGTFNGRSTVNIAANCKESAIIYTLDLPLADEISTLLQLHPWDEGFIRKRDSGKWYRESVYASKVRQLRGDSGNFDFSPYAGTIDLIFIDGSHSYDYVLKDSTTALQLCSVNNKSIILWHDYSAWDDVTLALNYLYRNDPAFSRLKRIMGTSLVILSTQ